MHQLHKRSLLVVGMAALAVSLVAACSSGASKGGSSSSSNSATAAGSGGLTLSQIPNPGKVVWVDAGGASTVNAHKAILDPFTAKTGITFETVSPSDIAQVRAQVSSGKVIWDIVQVGAVGLNNCDLLFQKVDKSLYDNLDKYPAGTVTPCNVPVNTTGIIMAYNTDLFGSKPPTSVKDFYDTTKFPGKRLVYDDVSSSGLYESALAASGVDPKSIYPLDLPRAEKQMDKIKNDLVIEPTFSAQQADLQANKWAFTIVLSGRAIASVQGGAHMKPLWDFNIYATGGPWLVKGGPNAQNAQLARAYMSTKESELAFTATNGLYPANPSIKQEEVAAVLSDIQKEWSQFIDPSKKGTNVPQDNNYFADNGNKLVNSYAKWKVG